MPETRVPVPDIHAQREYVLLASAARTATSAGSTAVTGFGYFSVFYFELDVTAAATEAGDTLDVFIQTQGISSNWVDVVHFTQVAGNGGAKRFLAKLSNQEPQTMFENGTALGAGSIRQLVGDAWRARWDVVDVVTSGNQSFTFSIMMAGYKY